MKYCDVCGTPNIKTNNYCIHCGNRIAIDNFCPFCGELNSDDSQYCSNCNNQIKPVAINSFDALFTDYNNILLYEATISDEDYIELLRNIFKKLDYFKLTGHTPKEKILSLASVFAECRTKSKGMDLGNEMGHVLVYDDRLDDSVQIATIIHELTHFLVFDIVMNLICYILQVKPSSTLEGFVWYFLSEDLALMNEFCAHTVEGRFIPHGYQSFGSFNNLLNEKQHEPKEINLAMGLGNTFAYEIILFLEKYIDEGFRESIKLQYKKDLKDPSYDFIDYDKCFETSVKNNLIFDKLYLCFIRFLKSGNYDKLIELKIIIEKRM